ncbi:MAG: hypothetical protein JKY08_10570 [Flavobacteriaceae bacterium]|nr:hypothetical protein [Flavobacteriaceae bacterium]
MMSLLMFLVANLDGLMIYLFVIMISPAILFMIIGIVLRLKKYLRGSKIFFIVTGVYLLISSGFFYAIIA